MTKFNNIFVLSTGRCGSKTFWLGCQFIENYRAGHEVFVAEVGESRLDYPDRWIEIDSRLAFFTGRLFRRFGDSALYVHLRKDPERVAESYMTRWGGGIIAGYSLTILFGATKGGDEPEEKKRALCLDYVLTQQSNIDHFVSGCKNNLTLNVEEPSDFIAFWERIGATGDLDKALHNMNRRINKDTLVVRSEEN